MGCGVWASAVSSAERVWDVGFGRELSRTGVGCGVWGEYCLLPFAFCLLSPVSCLLTPDYHCGLIIGAAGREGEGMGAGVGEAAGWGEVSLSLTK